MGQSLSNLYVHLIFSTKDRRPFVQDSVRNDLHSYAGQVLKTMGCNPTSIGSVEDHIHILFLMSRTVTIAKIVEEVKSDSSKWLKTLSPQLRKFSWQSGYGAFSVSKSKLQEVKHYIEKQREHHRHRGFQEEYRAFLNAHEVDYDERYVWD